MKKLINTLKLVFVAILSLVVANCETKNETANNRTPNPLSKAEMKAQRKKWEASPDGIRYNQWKTSADGKKVLASAAKISKHGREFSEIEAVIVSLSLPPGSRLGFGFMAQIDGEYYILNFDTQKSQVEALKSLKVNDKIIVRTRNVMHAPKYTYAIVKCDYVERNGKVIYKRIPSKNGC